MTERTDLDIQDNDIAEEGIRIEMAQATTSEEDQNGEKKAEGETEENQGEAQAAAQPAIPVEKIDGIDTTKLKATLTAVDGTPIELPEGTQLARIDVFGNDLVLVEADGSLILIIGGASNPPTILLGTIEIPASVLSASLGSGAAIVPAAGPDTAQGPDSSGQNFEVDPGFVGDPLIANPLLPPTAFDRSFATVEEFVPLLENEPPLILDPNGPLVRDPALPTGTDPGSTDETSIGIVVIQPGSSPIVDIRFGKDLTAADLAGIKVRDSSGQIIRDADGNAIVFRFEPSGDDKILAYVNGDADPTFVMTVDLLSQTEGELQLTLLKAFPHQYGVDGGDFAQVTGIPLEIEDANGNTASDTTVAQIFDDLPVANPDTDMIQAGGYDQSEGEGGEFFPAEVTGNVITDAEMNGDMGADVIGADLESVLGVAAGVSGVAAGNTNTVIDDGTGVGVMVSGLYGTVIIEADGTYTYTLDNLNPDVIGLGGDETLIDTFTYTLLDGDGDAVTTTLKITVKGFNEPPVIEPGEDLRVSEESLAGGIIDTDGNLDLTDSLTDDSNVTVFDPDGDPLIFTLTAPVGAFTSQGEDVVWTPNGAGNVLTGESVVDGRDVIIIEIDGSGNYSVELKDQFDHPDGGGENEINFSVGVVVSDGSLSASTSFNVTVEDDSPVAGLEPEAELDELVLDETRPEGTETDGDSVPAGLASVPADFSDNFDTTPDFGADQPGTISYSLALNGSDVGSGMFALGVDGAAGDEIVLNQNPDGSITGSAGGTDYFTISIDALGEVTFTQLANVWHLDTGDDDDTSTLTTASAADLQVVQTLTDADGDSDTAAVDIGAGVFKIEDDGPTAAVDVEADLDELVLDETRPEGTETDGDSDPAGLASVQADFSDNFDTTPDFGTDGAGTISYSLALNGSDVGSGMFALGVDGAAGDEIVLNQNPDGSITGSAGGTDYFTISIDALGEVTFTQLANVWHLDTGDDDDTSTLTTASAADLQVVQTLTDADGDSDTAAVDIGAGVFKIEDDGPTAAVDVEADLDELVLDETRPEGTETDGDSDPAGLASVQADFSDNFDTTPDFGTDGAGTISYSLALNGSDVGSGMFALGVDGAAGDEIVLNQNPDGSITGSAGGTDYFTISIDALGEVTFTQLANVWHLDTGDDDDTSTLTTASAADLQVVQTLTDADGDSDTAAVDIGAGVFKIEDDGPTAAVDVEADLDELVLDETRPEGTETDGDSDPAGLASVQADFSDNFDTTPDFGTDGAGTISYSLALNGSDVGSGMFALGVDGAAGDEIVLNQNPDGSITGSAGGTDYFTISIDALGEVTFTQLANVWHLDTGDDDDTSTLTTASAADLQVVQTLTDADGDSDTAAVDIGAGVFKIEDDGPTAAVDVEADLDELVLDETRPEGTETDGDSDPAGLASVQADFSDNFDTTPDFGTDGAGTISYSLALNGSDVGSGMFALGVDGAAGDEIVLNQNPDGSITGSAGGTDYFTISIDALGEVTFTQLANVWHLDTGDDDDTSTLTTASAADLQVVQTLTDADGDSDTAAVDIGAGVFKIEDDGPTAAVDVEADLDELVLDETRPEGTETDGDSDPAGLASVQADFSDNFDTTPDFGTDGAGTISYSLALNGSDVGSGMFALGVDGAAGDEIVLNQNPDGSITGSVGGTDYFTIEILDPATGVVTFTQINNVWHAETDDDDDTSTLTTELASDLQVVQTVTDADGDSDTAAVDLGAGVFMIEDDGPSADLSEAVMISVDEDDLDNFDEGDSDADGVEGSKGTDGTGSTTSSFTLGGGAAVANFGTDGAGTFGFVTQATAAALILALGAAGYSSQGSALTSATVVGNTVTAIAADGREIFTLELTNAAHGTYEFTLLDQLDHVAPVSAGDTLTLDLSGLIEITDADGDLTALSAGSVNVAIEDDEPLDISPTPSIVANSGSAAGASALDYFENVGADEPGTVKFTGINGGAAEGDGAQLFQADGTTPVTTLVGGLNIYLFGFGTDTLWGSTNPLFNPLALDGTQVFQVTLNPDGSVEANDQYNIVFFQQLDDGTGIDFSGAGFSEAGQNRFQSIADEDVPLSGENILFSATEADGTIGRVNTNAGQVSVEQNGAGIDDNEIIRFDFVDNIIIDGSNAASQTYDYGAHYTVNGFTFNIAQVTDPTVGVIVRAYDTDDDDPAGTGSGNSVAHYDALIDGGRTQDTITKITVNGVEIDLGNPAVALSDGNGGYSLFNISLNDVIAVTTADGYNQIEISNVDDDADDGFAINNFGFNVESTGSDIPLTFDVEVTDEDGDASTGQIDIVVTPDDGTVTGMDGVEESLIGGSGGDTLDGGVGSDLLAGNGGSDVFVINDASAIDDITDYIIADDVVDLSELFTADIGGGNAATDELSDFVQLANGDTELQVDVDGGGDTFITVATLDGSGGVNVIFDDNGTDDTGNIV